MSHSLNDVMNVEQIKSSKLFKKFLESEQSEGMTKSGERTNTGFQESPFIQQPAFQSTHLDSLIKSNQQNLTLSQQANFSKQKKIKNQHPPMSPPGNYPISNQNLNISSGSEQSKTFGTNRQLQLSHQYFQPPTPQYQANSTLQTQTVTQSPDRNSILNLSQKILNNQRKQQFSPERFYFNPPAKPVKTANIQNSPENNDNSQAPTQARTQNNSKHAKNNNFSDDKATFHVNNYYNNSNSKYSTHFPTSKGQQFENSIEHQEFKESERGYIGTFNHDPQDQPMVAGDLVRSIDIPQVSQSQGIYNDEREYNQRMSMLQLQQQQQEQQIGMQVPQLGGMGRNQEHNNKYSYQQQNSKQEVLSASSDQQRPLDWQGIESQMQMQEEQVAQIYLSLEKEEKKSEVLLDTIAGLRNQVTSLEADKAEIRTQLLTETEANTRDTQKYISQIDTLSRNIAELESREENIRADLEKTRQNMLRDELTKQKLEDELREARNKIQEQVQVSYLTNERASERLSENQKQQFRDVEEKEENIRRSNEYQMKLQAYLVENERLKNENYNLNRQLHDAQLRAELVQTDLNNQKQLVIEKSQKENTLIVQLDKATLESFQLRGLLSRAQTQFTEIPAFRSPQFDPNSAILDQYKPVPQPQYDSLRQPQARYPRTDDDRSEKSAASQQFVYRRGRFSNENEEEAKMNSPSRIYYKPQDHNIFGDTNSTYSAQRPGEYLYSPGKRAELVKPRDNNLFAGGVDDTYQPNPMKIGSISLSPQRRVGSSMRGSIAEMPPAGMRKQPDQQMNLGGTSQQDSRFQGRSDIDTLERNIALMSKDRLFLETELRRLEDLKFKSGADIRRKGEVNRELEQLEKSISQQKIQLRLLQ